MMKINTEMGAKKQISTIIMRIRVMRVYQVIQELLDSKWKVKKSSMKKI